jgi:hypothetical protein
VSRRTGEYRVSGNHEIPPNHALSQEETTVSPNKGICAGIWLLSEAG